uniref:Uracil phosphoribosyltransferase n=1 Tax=Spermothamnion repens TaxID=31383 RepID=A0A4D6WYN2_9FLOR|nr:hypothetical protein [Spermothamnion repens]
MQLNIYLISHPIIKLLSQTIINNQANEAIMTNSYKQIGLFLTYETTRKWIKIHNIYLKKFNKIQQMTLLDPNRKYYIFTKLSNTYKMLVDIQLFLPNMTIIDTVYENNIVLKNKKINHLFDKTSKEIKIIIFDNILQESYAIQLIKYLNQYINTKDIYITCISCYEKTLHIIGQSYPELQIYTTKII